MRKSFRWLLRLIGPALLILALSQVDLSRLVAGLVQVRWAPLVLSLVLIFPFVFIKSWRWVILMRELGLNAPSLGYAMVLYTIGLFLGGTTPGQSGDFVKAWYLRDRGLPLPPVLFSIVLDRLFDFVVMAVLAVLGVVIFVDVLPSESQQTARIAIIAFAVLVVVLTPLLMARGPREWLINLLLPVAPGKVRTIIERWRDQLNALTLRFPVLVQLILASVGSAASTMVRIWLLYLSLPLGDIPLLAIVSSTALIAILQALPISFAGIGVRDVVLIALLARYGYPSELALILSALFLLLNIEHILVGFLVSLRYPLGTPPPADIDQREAVAP